MDYLPIQASSVPCERAFSSSAETDTHRRNRISPVLMEALQMLKYILNSSTMDFTSDILTPEADLIMDTNVDLLANLSFATGDLMRENAMDKIVVEIEDGADSAEDRADASHAN
jgi:hypothetical protein